MAREPRKFLTTAYEIGSAVEARRHYADWAASYDDELAEQRYATPARCAEALASLSPDLSAPVLDIGCGTGLSGLALAEAGFTAIDGTDLSPEMLEKAKARRVYRKLFPGDLSEPLPVARGDYAAMAAVGVINPGHAPPETVDAVLSRLLPGGLFVFSLNDHAAADPAFAGKVDDVIGRGAAECPFREHGPHLPGIGLEATVFVLRRR